MSNLINKAKDALSGNKTHHDSTTTSSTHHTTGNYGPHTSSTANAVDPRYDSTTGAHQPHQGHHGVGTSSTTTGGPHSSNLANRADPRVDSDFDHRANPQSRVPAYGTATTGHGTSSTTTAGPHSSNLANRLDPRVDSDRDHRNDPTSRVGGYGTQDTYGDATGYNSGHVGAGGLPGQTGTGGGGLTGHTGHSGAGGLTGTTGHTSHAAGGYTHNIGTQPSNYGTSGGLQSERVHDSKLLNRLDPKTKTDFQNNPI